MAELATFLGKKVGTIKLGDREFSVYRLNLNDLAELELKYGLDELMGATSNRRLNIMIDALTLSIQREDKTITREYVGSCIDPFDQEQMSELFDIYAKMTGAEVESPTQKKGKRDE